MMPALVPLSELRSDEAINPRSKGRDAGDAALVASIKARGLLQPLVVRGPERSLKAGGMEKRAYDVVDGRRRLKALIKIHGKTPVEIPVVFVEGDETTLREMALAANVVRAALHPVDEYDAYRDLIDSGLSVEDVAAHFGVKEKWVRQRLQLATLAPELRQTWRLGKMTAEQAEALSSAPDHARQCAAWNASRDEWRRKPDSLRATLRSSAPAQNDGRVKLIGLEAYLAAGGGLTDDLFSEVRLLTDAALLDRLVEAKLQETSSAYLSEGWAWAKTEAQMQAEGVELLELDVTPWMTEAERAEMESKKISWPRRNAIEVAARGRAIADPAARARSGVVVDVRHDGAIDLQFLMVADKSLASGDEAADAGDEPDDDESADAPNEAEPTEAAPKVNWTLRETLSEQLTLALSRALAAAPDVALAALVASFETTFHSYGASPLRLTNADAWRGIAPSRDGEEDHPRDWPAEFAKARAASLDALLRRLAELVATTLDMRAPRFDGRNDWDEARPAAIAAVVDALPPQPFSETLAEAFDAEAYFKRVNAETCVAALREMNGYDAALSKKKAALVAHASLKAKAASWLPPELRTAAYKGPAATEAA
jgi:ParB family chromosome partitioning protein